VSGLHNPKETLVERILEEIKEDDLKYRTFVRRDDQ
jgi:putative nucleotide binding protein